MALMERTNILDIDTGHVIKSIQFKHPSRSSWLPLGHEKEAANSLPLQRFPGICRGR
jgi:hypothetical protein